MTDGPLLMQPRPWFSVDSGCCYQQEQKMAFGTCHFVCLVYGYNAAAGACLLSRVRRAPPTWPYPAPWWSCMLFLYVRRFWNASSWCVRSVVLVPHQKGHIRELFVRKTLVFCFCWIERCHDDWTKKPFRVLRARPRVQDNRNKDLKPCNLLFWSILVHLWRRTNNETSAEFVLVSFFIHKQIYSLRF